MRDSRNMTEHASRRGTLGRRLKEGESAQSSPTLMINATAKSFLAIEQKASTPPLKMRKGCLKMLKA